MKIGTYSSGNQRNPIEDMFIDEKRFGYDYIELVTANMNEPRLYAKGAINNLKELLEV